MNEEQRNLVTYWWEKMYPLRRKFVRETILGGFDKDDLEQECFLQLIKALDTYRPEMGVPFESYYKISLYGWRANQNRVKARMELAFGEEEMLSKADENVDVERNVERKILSEEVCRKINELEEIERKIIEAYYLQNKKMIEIANELVMPLKTVEYRKRKALNTLRSTLELSRQ